MTLAEYMSEKAVDIEQVLEGLLPRETEEPEIIHEAMRYSTLGGGKRLRAIMALAAEEAVGGQSGKALEYAAALEMIHAYSLIHDDLPCMDDDDMRRGKPANHVVFGDAVAVLAGDALLPRAFEVICTPKQQQLVGAVTVVNVMRELAISCGSQGLVGGQVVDLISEGKKIAPEVLSYIHEHKTGALFKAAVRGGAMIGGANDQQLQDLTVYSQEFGLAFQIVDDILDIVGDQTALGKKLGSDESRRKATYPSVYGLKKAKEMAKECVQKCQMALGDFSADAWVLRELTQYVLDRTS